MIKVRVDQRHVQGGNFVVMVQLLEIVLEDTTALKPQDPQTHFNKEIFFIMILLEMYALPEIIVHHHLVLQYLVV